MLFVEEMNRRAETAVAEGGDPAFVARVAHDALLASFCFGYLPPMRPSVTMSILSYQASIGLVACEAGARIESGYGRDREREPAAVARRMQRARAWWAGRHAMRQAGGQAGRGG